jgi:hypothetical protein
VGTAADGARSDERDSELGLHLGLAVVRMNGWLCGFDFYQLARRRWMGNGCASFLEVFEVKLNRLSNESEYFFFRAPDSDTTRQVRHICPK